VHRRHRRHPRPSAANVRNSAQLQLEFLHCCWSLQPTFLVAALRLCEAHLCNLQHILQILLNSRTQNTVILLMSFWVNGAVGRSHRFREASASASIFRAETMGTAHFLLPTLASTNQSTRRFNPKEHHQSRPRRENLKSQKYNDVCYVVR
jgi:hypothetical protein